MSDRGSDVRSEEEGEGPDGLASPVTDQELRSEEPDSGKANLCTF